MLFKLLKNRKRKSIPLQKLRTMQTPNGVLFTMPRHKTQLNAGFTCIYQNHKSNGTTVAVIILGLA